MADTLIAQPDALTRTRLRRFLNCYWLRPENAFWMTLRSEALPATTLPAPCVDLSCGDGVFSFLHAGGDFDLDFDVFTCVDDVVPADPLHADMFDHADTSYRPVITTRPAAGLAAGTDLKPNLLRKAETLEFYERLVRHDSNERLPFDNETFATVHCNSAYWVVRIDPFLAEIRRVLRPGGRALLSVKTSVIRGCTLDAFDHQFDHRFLDLIGRGRFDCWSSLTDRDGWLRRFDSAGLSVVDERPFITRSHAHIWDIGLRPVAPLLVRMARAIDPTTRRSIKADWIELVTDLLMPITRPDFSLSASTGDPVEILFELTPR